MLIHQSSAAHAQAGDAESVQSAARGCEIPSIHAVFRGFFALDFRFRRMLTSDPDCANRCFIRMNAAFSAPGLGSHQDTYVNTLFSLQFIWKSVCRVPDGIPVHAALRLAGADECVRPT
jgi:hypothetical protein